MIINNRYSSDIKYVCLCGSTYSLLLYILVYGEKQFRQTFFFVSDAISLAVQSNLQHYKYLSFKRYMQKPKLVRLMYSFYLKSFSWLIWPFLRKSEIYGADHLWFTAPLLKKRSMIVLEDGLANYDVKELIRTTNLKHKWLYKLVYGPIKGKGEYGLSDQVSRIILTNIAPIPELVKKKVEVVNINTLWNSNKDNTYINRLFNFTETDIRALKNKRVLILAQPYNLDIGDDELVKIYKRIINSYSTDKIVIKPHPRDTIDYTKIFPDIFVYDKIIPVELFSLNNIVFSDIYTIDSTSIFSFSKENSHLHFLGYECHPLLLEKYGKNVVNSLLQK